MIYHIIGQIIGGTYDTTALTDTEWQELTATATEHYVGSYLAWVLDKRGILSALPAAAQESLAQTIHEDKLYYLLHQQVWLDIQTKLTSANMDVMTIKGMALSHVLYPEPHLRPMHDIDMLVRYTEREQALALLTSAGYEDKTDRDFLAGHGIAYHYNLQQPQNPTEVELHFLLLGADMPPEQMAFFWQHTQLIQGAKADFLTLQHETHILYLCAHIVLQHGENDFHLVRYLDLHLLITQCRLDWEQLIRWAGELGWSYAVYRALKYTAEYFTTPLPEDVLTRLEQQAAPHEKYIYSQDSIAIDRTRRLLKQIPLHRRLLYLLKDVIPPPAYMRERYEIPPEESLTIRHYLQRWQRGLRMLRTWLREKFQS